MHQALQIHYYLRYISYKCICYDKLFQHLQALIILGAGIRKQPPGTPDEQWKQLRSEPERQIQELTILSGNSKFLLDTGSSHFIQNDNPEIFVKSIQMVIHSITSKTKL